MDSSMMPPPPPRAPPADDATSRLLETAAHLARQKEDGLRALHATGAERDAARAKRDAARSAEMRAQLRHLRSSVAYGRHEAACVADALALRDVRARTEAVERGTGAGTASADRDAARLARVRERKREHGDKLRARAAEIGRNPLGAAERVGALRAGAAAAGGRATASRRRVAGLKQRVYALKAAETKHGRSLVRIELEADEADGQARSAARANGKVEAEVRRWTEQTREQGELLAKRARLLQALGEEIVARRREVARLSAQLDAGPAQRGASALRRYG